MDPEDMTVLIEDFVDKNYPKGHEDRGFAIVILAQFLLENNVKKVI